MPIIYKQIRQPYFYPHKEVIAKAVRVNVSDEVKNVRWSHCVKCVWNISNKCQHTDQGCAPCRQGVGLRVAVARLDFKCPLKLF